MRENSPLLAILDTILEHLVRAPEVVYQNRVKQQGAISAGDLIFKPVFERQRETAFERFIPGAIIGTEQRSSDIA
jgi:hypothetical protein